MPFNSWSFILFFLPVFLLAWQWLVKGPSGHASLLLLASIIFYAFSGTGSLILLVFLLCCNYFFGLRIQANTLRPSAKKIWLSAALAFNILPLLWFKYSWFVIQNLALIFNAQWLFTPPVFPLGISFYTFIQIAWLVGIYRGGVRCAGLARHLVFSSCFAYIISGPIVRYEEIGPQLDSLPFLEASNLAMGLTLFTLGLAKKNILADSIGFYADTIFNAAQKGWPLAGAEAWLGSLCYTFQLYFDFSGYTDMALGIGLMIGLSLPENFNSPYKSTGIVDFWRRWHITLGSWLRDFLYIPLGGNRHGKARQYRNLFLTMLIGGAWHGAGWTYIIWGALHGLMLCVNHFFRSVTKGATWAKYLSSRPFKIFSIAFTFFCLNFCWIVFRSQTLDCALVMYKSMFCGPFVLKNVENGGAMALENIFMPTLHTIFPNHYFSGWQPAALIAFCALVCWGLPNSGQIMRGCENGCPLAWRPDSRWASGIALLAFASILFMGRSGTFLYFQF